MKDDPIVAEVRKIREEMLASYGGDFERMFQDIMKRQWESGHPVVSFPLKGSKAKVAEKQTEYKVESGKRK